MTPQEIINVVLEDLERPDFESLAPSKFHEALRMVHSIENFQQDLAQEVIPVSELLVFNQQATFPAPQRLRKIWRIYSRDNLGHTINRRFIDLRNNVSAVDYFGVKAYSTFSRFGRNLTLTGISAESSEIVVDYISFPRFEFDTEQQTWVTDSWLLEETPFTVQYYLQFLLANLTDSDDQKAAAQLLVANARRALLSDYVENILEDPDNGWTY